MNLANGKKAGLMMEKANKALLKKRARLLLSCAILKSTHLQIHLPHLPHFGLARARLSTLKLNGLKPFARLAKARALISSPISPTAITAHHQWHGQDISATIVAHYHLHAGDNRLGENCMGDNRLGDNRLSQYLRQSTARQDIILNHHHVTHHATQKLASLNMTKILHGGDDDRQDYVPKLQAHMGLVKVRDASDSAETPDASGDNDAPLRAYGQYDGQYIERVIRKIISVKTHRAGNHQQNMGMVADGSGQYNTGGHHGGRNHATGNMMGQPAQSLQQIVRQEINPLKAEFKAEFKAQLQDVMRGQQAIIAEAVIAETVQNYQAQHVEDEFFSSATHKADMWGY